jgi:hypothetical protein
MSERERRISCIAASVVCLVAAGWALAWMATPERHLAALVPIGVTAAMAEIIRRTWPVRKGQPDTPDS